MTLLKITADEAARMLAAGATLVDVREPDEFARERVGGALNAPLSHLDQAELPVNGALVFHCRSGARTNSASGRLAAKVAGACDAHIVEGGLDALARAGVPVTRDPRQPLEMQRQVQIGAGAMVLAEPCWASPCRRGSSRCRSSPGQGSSWRA